MNQTFLIGWAEEWPGDNAILHDCSWVIMHDQTEWLDGLTDAVGL